jgi:O-antigen/teichoic acid export membrane protein
MILMEDVSSEIRKVTIGTFLTYASQIIFLILIPRLFGPDKYGTLSFLISTLAMFTTASSMGIEIILYRYIPEIIAQDRREEINALVHQCLRIRLAALMPFMILWLVILPMFAVQIELVIIGGFWLAVTCINEMLFSITYGMGKSGWYVAQGAIRLTLRIPLLILGFITLDLFGAMVGLLGIECILLGIGLTFTKDYIFKRPNALASIRGHFIQTGQLFIAQLLFTIYAWLPLFFAIHFLTDVFVGYYSLGAAFGTYLTGLFNSLSTALFPKIVEINTQQQYKVLVQLVETTAKYLAIIATLIVLWLFFLIGYVVLIIAPSYLPSINVGLVAILGSIPMGITEVYRRVSMANDRNDMTLITRLAAYCVFISLTLLLLPSQGIMGIVTSYVFGRFTEGILLTGWTVRVFSLRIPKRAFLLCPIMIFSCVTLLYWINPADIIFLSMLLLLATLFYLAVLVGTRTLTRQDISILKRILFPTRLDKVKP